jgi:hypothetical protein
LYHVGRKTAQQHEQLDEPKQQKYPYVDVNQSGQDGSMPEGFLYFFDYGHVCNLINSFFLPVFNQDKTKKHTPQVGKVGHVVEREIGHPQK